MTDPELLSWIERGQLIAALLVAIGVAGEFAGSFIARPINRRIETARQAEVAQATAQSESARKDIAEAGARIAEAQRESAEANAKAEGFRRDISKANESAKQAEARAAEASLELARFKAPRTLNPPQQESIAARLRPFAPKQVDVIVIGDAQEIAVITASIVAAIQQAGWTVRPIVKAVSGPNISGVLVGTHTGSDRGTIEAADVLISALQAAGIASNRFTPQFGDELPMALMGDWKSPVAPIRIMIGAKP